MCRSRQSRSSTCPEEPCVCFTRFTRPLRADTRFKVESPTRVFVFASGFRTVHLFIYRVKEINTTTVFQRNQSTLYVNNKITAPPLLWNVRVYQCNHSLINVAHPKWRCVNGLQSDAERWTIAHLHAIRYPTVRLRTHSFRVFAVVYSRPVLILFTHSRVRRVRTVDKNVSVGIFKL